jgi:hypothetical protein
MPSPSLEGSTRAGGTPVTDGKRADEAVEEEGIPPAVGIDLDGKRYARKKEKGRAGPEVDESCSVSLGTLPGMLSLLLSGTRGGVDAGADVVLFSRLTEDRIALETLSMSKAMSTSIIEGIEKDLLSLQICQESVESTLWSQTTARGSKRHDTG